jgi:hypothetical protein
VLVINNLHLMHRDDEGYAMLHALQQRAEVCAMSLPAALTVDSPGHKPTCSASSLSPTTSGSMIS